MKLRVINADEVRQLLPMTECMEAIADAMQATCAGTVRAPPRLLMPLLGDCDYLCLMPGSSAEPRIDGVKIVTIHPSNPAVGRYAVQGFVILFDHETGTPLTMIEGGTITAIRTAAASGIATRYLARTDAHSHGIFGTGVQAATHIDAILAARPIDEVIIWGRNTDKAKTLAKEYAARTSIGIRVAKNPEEAAACDIVTTVTGASEPILIGDWIDAGTHVNLVGAHSPKTREADSDLITKASVFTDLLESLFNEAGDVLIPLQEGRIHRSDIKGEIGQVLKGELAGRTSDDEITVYKSLGIVAQDLFAAALVWSKAAADGIGTDIGFGS